MLVLQGRLAKVQGESLKLILETLRSMGLAQAEVHYPVVCAADALVSESAETSRHARLAAKAVGKQCGAQRADC